MNSLEKAAASNGSINLVTEWRDLRTKNYPVRKGANPNEMSLFGGIGQGSSAKAILKAAKRYARNHPNKSDREMLEGFIQSQFKQAFRNGRPGDVEVMEGLTGVQMHTFYSKRSVAKSQPKKRAPRRNSPPSGREARV